MEKITRDWWWVFITLAIVGYGGKFPVTVEGQWVAEVIVLSGIALLGTDKLPGLWNQSKRLNTRSSRTTNH